MAHNDVVGGVQGGTGVVSCTGKGRTAWCLVCCWQGGVGNVVVLVYEGTASVSARRGRYPRVQEGSGLARGRLLVDRRQTVLGTTGMVLKPAAAEA